MIGRRTFGIGALMAVGDKLVRPLNAPPAGNAAPGVQPGNTRLIVANKVIIIGDTGGLFVYAPTPAAGNLIASIAAEAGTDQFGNSYPAGIMGELQTNEIQFTSGGLVVGQLAPVGSGAEPPLTLLNEPFVTEAGTAANPTIVSTDTFHSLGGVTGTGCTVEQDRYQLTPEQECEIDIALVAAAGGSVAGTYTFANTLPAAYQFPGAFLRAYPFPFNAPITTATQDSVIVVDGTGAPVPGRVRITIPAVAANVVFTGTCRIPLT
jgi:hypothetical protein